MYFLYVDESGSKDPAVTGLRADGSEFAKDPLYVLLGVSLFEMSWFKFEWILNAEKLRLIRRLRRDEQADLHLADAELKSEWLRIPRQREKHPLLSRLTEVEVASLADLFYSQLGYHRMTLFAVVIDKRYLHAYIDAEKLHRKAYELLVERVEWFMRNEHRRHRAVFVVDDTNRQMNRSLAEKHSHFQREGTSSGQRIGHIVELPMFVESSLSNGVQLADLCAYNVYRVFRDGILGYEYFDRIRAYFYRSPSDTAGSAGIKVFPPQSPLAQLAAQAMERN